MIMVNHRTRYSDSSIMDEVCIYCGEYDGPFHHGLNSNCSISDPEERKKIEKNLLKTLQFRTKEWNRITKDTKPIPKELPY